MLQQIPISSSLISQLAYDDERKELHVTFKRSGARWIYGPGVTQDDADGVETGGGSWFLENVKGRYSERRA